VVIATDVQLSLSIQKASSQNNRNSSGHNFFHFLYSYCSYISSVIIIVIMSKKSSLLVSAAVLAVAAQTSEAFCPTSSFVAKSTIASRTLSPLYAEETKESTDAVFMPPAAEGEDAEESEPSIELDTVEMLGKGAAKVCISSSLMWWSLMTTSHFVMFIVAIGRRSGSLMTSLLLS
jgi:hypothetical protein